MSMAFILVLGISVLDGVETSETTGFSGSEMVVQNQWPSSVVTAFCKIGHAPFS